MNVSVNKIFKHIDIICSEMNNSNQSIFYPLNPMIDTALATQPQKVKEEAIPVKYHIYLT